MVQITSSFVVTALAIGSALALPLQSDYRRSISQRNVETLSARENVVGNPYNARRSYSKREIDTLDARQLYTLLESYGNVAARDNRLARRGGPTPVGKAAGGAAGGGTGKKALPASTDAAAFPPVGADDGAADGATDGGSAGDDSSAGDQDPAGGAGLSARAQGDLEGNVLQARQLLGFLDRYDDFLARRGSLERRTGEAGAGGAAAATGKAAKAAKGKGALASSADSDPTSDPDSLDSSAGAGAGSDADSTGDGSADGPLGDSDASPDGPALGAGKTGKSKAKGKAAASMPDDSSAFRRSLDDAQSTVLQARELFGLIQRYDGLVARANYLEATNA